jgi:hypothetical protein
MLEPIFMKLAMYIMASEPHLSGVLHKSLLSVCVFLCISLSLLGNGPERNATMATKYTSNNRKSFGLVVFYAVNVASRNVV